MKLENKYLVVKWDDISQALSQYDQYSAPYHELYKAACVLIRETGYIRYKQDKKEKKYLVIGEDWPEYAPALAMLSHRVDNENKIQTISKN